MEELRFLLQDIVAYLKAQASREWDPVQCEDILELVTKSIFHYLERRERIGSEKVHAYLKEVEEFFSLPGLVFQLNSLNYVEFVEEMLHQLLLEGAKGHSA